MSISLLMSFRMWQRNWDVFRMLWLHNTGGILVEPFFMLLAIGFGLGSLVKSDAFQGLSYGQFIAPGVIAGYAMFHSCGECTWGTYVRMVNQHTFEGILATPMSVDDLILGEMLWGATKAVISAVAVLAVAAVFGLIRSPGAVALVPLAFVVGLAFSAIAVSFTAQARSINAMESFYTLILTPMFFFSGAFYPVESMPQVVQPFIWVLPLTPAVRMMRDLTLQRADLTTLACLGLLLLWVAAFVPVALWLMRRRLIK